MGGLGVRNCRSPKSCARWVEREGRVQLRSVASFPFGRMSSQFGYLDEPPMLPPRTHTKSLPELAKPEPIPESQTQPSRTLSLECARASSPLSQPHRPEDNGPDQTHKHTHSKSISAGTFKAASKYLKTSANVSTTLPASVLHS